MRQWTLMDGSTDPTGDGIAYAQNVSLRIIGECGRRGGMALASPLGAVLIAPSFAPCSGYSALLVTPSGTIESVPL